MKMKKNKLVEIIREEIESVLKEKDDYGLMPPEKFTSIPRGRVRKQVVDKFMEAMRKALKRHESSINSSLDNFEDLNPAEVDKIQKIVNKNGWKLIVSDDNYNTTMYALIPLKKGNVKEDTDSFGDDERQFDMSFAFQANDKSDVVKHFNATLQKDKNWRNIKNIQEWIDNVGFKDADEAFYWLENMYNASKIKPGNAVAFHYSPNGWILAAKENGQIKEFITNGNELDILVNAAQDINRDIFNGRGQFEASNYQLIVRDSANEVLKKLDRSTEVNKEVKGFNAKEDEARQYYQLPDYNVAIALDQYRMTRGTIIQFLSFDGEFPKAQGMY